MKIVKNTIIPFKGFLAINLFGILFVRKELFHKLDDVAVNHEAIHTELMKELLYVGFYIIYLLEWLYRLLLIKNAHKAYRSISFEKEAYKYEDDLNYIEWVRKPYAMWKKPNFSN